MIRAALILGAAGSLLAFAYLQGKHDAAPTVAADAYDPTEWNITVRDGATRLTAIRSDLEWSDRVMLRLEVARMPSESGVRVFRNKFPRLPDTGRPLPDDRYMIAELGRRAAERDQIEFFKRLRGGLTK